MNGDCTVPPAGWTCPQPSGHTGPCLVFLTKEGLRVEDFTRETQRANRLDVENQRLRRQLAATTMPPVGTCDMGDCDDLTVAVVELPPGEWLPMCRRHAIVALGIYADALTADCTICEARAGQLYISGRTGQVRPEPHFYRGG